MTMSSLMNQIVISISEVMETMFYILVQPRDGYTTVGESPLLKSNGTYGSESIESAIITFHGTFSGTIALIVPENLLIIMTENFMGEKRQNLTDEHLEGTLKEALNMLAGNTFSKIDSELSFCLGVPEINTASIVSIAKEMGSYSKSPLIVIDTIDSSMEIIVHIDKTL